MKQVAKTFLIIVSLFLRFEFAAAGDGGDIQIEGIEVKLVDDQLAVSAEFLNLFSEKVRSTIQSGLTSVVQIEIRLKNSLQKELLSRRMLRTISFDIWEERYTVSDWDTTLFFLSFAEAQRSCSRLRDTPLMPSNNLELTSGLVLHMKVGISPISSKQAERVSDWLLNPNQRQEYLASQNRTNSFEINLNRLVSFFVSSRNSSNYVSEWFNSRPFNVSDLAK